MGSARQKAVRGTGKSLPSSVSHYADRVGDRIGVAVDRIGSNIRAGEIAGITDEQIARWRAGSPKPSLYGLMALAKATGLSFTWMATGEGPREADESARDSWAVPSHVLRTQREHEDGMLQIVDPKALENGALVLLPKLRVEAAAGAGALVDDEEASEMIAFDAAWLRARQITPKGAHVITARGDSMEPTIRSGDLLIVDRAISVAVDSGIYAIVYNGLVLVKRLFMLHDGGILLSSDNKIAGRDEEIKPHEIDQLHIAGRVMWYGRVI